MRRFGPAIWALVRLRCPRCRRGRMFHGSFAMNDPCPECGLVFQREEGYFLAAMYVSYALSVVLIGGAYWAVTSWLPGIGVVPTMLLTLSMYLPFAPAVFRYSRGIWIYLDRLFFPTASQVGAYERLRMGRSETATETDARS
jgi:uncharacterized protein (DUF983 family)